MSVNQALLYPDPQRRERLLSDLCALHSQLDCVQQIAVFGSLARGQADRWSDVDLLVITRSGPPDFWRVFSDLREQRPVLHHHVFMPQALPAGGHVLGILFDGKSVLHNVDLNFVSEAEALLAANMERFGPLRWLYTAPAQSAPVAVSAGPPPEALLPQHPDDQRIGAALHWTKKAIKRWLRGVGPAEPVAAAAAPLRQVMQDFPEDVWLPTGNLCRAARLYLQMAAEIESGAA